MSLIGIPEERVWRFAFPFEKALWGLCWCYRHHRPVPIIPSNVMGWNIRCMNMMYRECRYNGNRYVLMMFTDPHMTPKMRRRIEKEQWFDMVREDLCEDYKRKGRAQFIEDTVAPGEEDLVYNLAKEECRIQLEAQEEFETIIPSISASQLRNG